MRNFAIFLSPFLFAFNASIAASTSSQVATITQIQGKAEIFTNPSKKPHENKSTETGTMALYEGEYFLIQQAKIGDQVLNNTVIRTLPNARLNVVYENGDQFNLGSGTAYRVTWNPKSNQDAKLQLMYGRLRGVISKEGPRQKFMIKTRSATMGVRGTDFYISDEGNTGITEVSVLRGSISVSTGKKDEEVKTGMSALISTHDEKSKLALRETTKEDLGMIENQSTITEPVAIASPELTKKVAELEKKALQVTSKDIQLYQPELYKKVADAKSVQEMNAKLITLVTEKAPEAIKRNRPTPR